MTGTALPFISPGFHLGEDFTTLGLRYQVIY